MQGFKGFSGRIVVCSPATFPAFFVDDVFGACALCGQRVRFRPHAPAPRSLVCLPCFLLRPELGEVCTVTPETLDELVALGPDVPKC